MNRFKNILLYCNFDINQHRAIHRAVTLAKQNNARLSILSVIKEPPVRLTISSPLLSDVDIISLARQEHKERIDIIRSEIIQQGINPRSITVVGIPFLEIIRQVLKQHNDLVILAAEGDCRLRERLFGSTSLHLMRKCPCPVWVIKPDEVNSYQQILAAVDTSIDFPDKEHDSLNPLILQLGSSLADMDNSQFHVVQIWSVFAEGYMEGRGGLDQNSVKRVREQVRKQYRTWLNNLLAHAGMIKPAQHVHLLRKDNASKAIIRLIVNEKIDLLVIGTVCRTGLAGFFIGNTAEQVLNEVNCSVLTVKPDGFITPVTL